MPNQFSRDVPLTIELLYLSMSNGTDATLAALCAVFPSLPPSTIASALQHAQGNAEAAAAELLVQVGRLCLCRRHRLPSEPAAGFGLTATPSSIERYSRWRRSPCKRRQCLEEGNSGSGTAHHCSSKQRQSLEGGKSGNGAEHRGVRWPMPASRRAS